MRTVALLQPRYEPSLKLKVTDWARPISATDLSVEERAINTAIGSWSSAVIGRFSESLAAALKSAGFNVEAIPQSDASATQSGKHAASIRSFLTAGFVYKTFTSATYAPFCQVVIEANVPKGVPLYRRIYSATDRSLNLFITNFPASTRYVFAEINTLQSEREQAIEALATLAVQLAQKFAAELVA
jgi:hypothetical protein